MESALLRLAIPEEREVLSAGVYIESLADTWDAATPEERREMLRFMLVGIYADTTTRRIVALKPKTSFAPLFALSPSLTQEDDHFLVTDPQIYQPLDVISGDDGIRTRDLLLDRQVC